MECRQSELSTAQRKQTLLLKSQAVELLPNGAANLTKLQVGLPLGLSWEVCKLEGPISCDMYPLLPHPASGRK